MGPHSKHTVQRIRLATIGGGCPCTLSLSSVPGSSTYETINFELPCGFPLQLRVLVLLSFLGNYSWTFQKKFHLHQQQSFLEAQM